MLQSTASSVTCSRKCNQFKALPKALIWVAKRTPLFPGATTTRANQHSKTTPGNARARITLHPFRHRYILYLTESEAESNVTRTPKLDSMYRGSPVSARALVTTNRSCRACYHFTACRCWLAGLVPMSLHFYWNIHWYFQRNTGFYGPASRGKDRNCPTERYGTFQIE